MIIENILLIGPNGWVDFDQPLRERGCKVLRAPGFEVAQEILAKSDVDLIVADPETLAEADLWNSSALLLIVGAPYSAAELPLSVRQRVVGYISGTAAELQRALESAEAQSRLMQLSRSTSDQTVDFIGVTPAVEGLRQVLRKIAATQATVLISGETGVGKALLACQIQRQSPRSDAPLCRVDCSAVPAEALETQLFGTEARSQRSTRRQGLLELAHGGTLLVEHVDAMSSAIQEKLLRYLDEGAFQRAGGARTLNSDVRIIATTSQDLAAKTKRGEFREDLLIRLGIVLLEVPPLRERKADIRALADYFRQQFSRRYGSEAVAFSPAAVDLLENYDWPGNVAELKHVIGRAVILAASSSVIEAEHLRLGSQESSKFKVQSSKSDGEIQTLGEMERRHILSALERCQWNRTHAAARLGISIRTLRNKLREYRSGGIGVEVVEEQTAEEAA